MHLQDPPRRRRGTELEDALLDATWAELTTHGYAALTLDSVAQRAGTSRPVIARRWPSKADLVRAAVERMLGRDPMAPPDTGSLRGDMLAIIRHANEHRIGTTALLVYYLGAYFQETGTNPAQLREGALAGRASGLDVIFERAIARGEVDPDRLTPRARTVAIDLFRHEALMTLEPIPDDVLVSIVDDVFLPLVLKT